MTKYNWPLADNNFTLIDRLKICCFFLNYKNRWTQDKYVKKYEEIASKYVGAKYAIFVSSGSAANQLICQKIKDDLILEKKWPSKNKVILSAISWQTNASVWVREGFEPIFLDATLNDFCLDYRLLDSYLATNAQNTACVFPTSVLGYVPNIDELINICNKYNVKLKLDNCENSEGKFKRKNICGYGITCSTSTFIAHQWNNGQEGGFIFTDDLEEYEYFILSRAHGLSRNLLQYNLNNDKYKNDLVDSRFDFQTLSSNYRNSEVAALCGLLDSKRWLDNRLKRASYYNLFKNKLDLNKFFLPNNRESCEDIAFCLPIIIKNADMDLVNKTKKRLDLLGIERRSFISGNMLRQLPYKKYANYKDFINAEYLNNFGMYIGLNFNISNSQIVNLCDKLNKL